jgi:hypothetical protein
MICRPISNLTDSRAGGACARSAWLAVLNASKFRREGLLAVRITRNSLASQLAEVEASVSIGPATSPRANETP